MSTRRPQDSIGDAPDVERAFRRARFDEEPPAHVDRAVLAAARQRRGARLKAFVPAFALAATLVLSFSLVLRSGMLGMGGEEPGFAGSSPADLSEQPALETVAPGGGFAEPPSESGVPSRASPRRERAANEPAAAPLSQAPVPNADIGAAATEAEAPVQALQAVDSALEESAERRSIIAGDGAEDCASTSGGEPAPWLACISRHLAGGAVDAARLQLETFLDAHPDYPLPENLEALREP